MPILMPAHGWCEAIYEPLEARQQSKACFGDAVGLTAKQALDFFDTIMMTPIVLMTDFGTQDSYVGVMKGVMAGIAPGVPLIDLTHEIRPQDIEHGAYTLQIAVPYFPAKTIFCCVVDPGVGSQRRAIGLELGTWYFILPDNGLLTYLLTRWPIERVVTLSNLAYQLPQPSATFHGRDIFAPAAAHLAAGVPLEALGESLPLAELRRLTLPSTRWEGEQLYGSIMHIDRFGNLISTIHRQDLADRHDWRVELTGTMIKLPHISYTFADVALGEPVAYIGSDGYLELAVRNGNAAEEWGVGLGREIVLEKK